jgi:hypothetical protein
MATSSAWSRKTDVNTLASVVGQNFYAHTLKSGLKVREDGERMRPASADKSSVSDG